MGILIRTTFDVISADSAQSGDPAERGWIDEVGTEYGFRELVELARACEASSSAPHPGAWLTAYRYHEDDRSGRVENRSYHPVSERDARYFVRAIRAAGLWE